MNEPEMSCEQALQQLALYLDHELTDTDEAGVRAHLHRCKSCYSRAEFESRLKGQLAALRRTEVSGDLAQRITGMLHTFATAEEE